MATQPPPRQSLIKTLTLTTSEQLFSFPSATTIIDMVMQVVSADATAYVSVVAGGTIDPALRWRLLGPTANKRGDLLHFQDVNFTFEEGLYVRALADTPIIQIWYSS